MSSDTAEAILARFPGPVTMPASRLKLACILLGSVAFAVMGFFVARFGTPKDVGAGWFLLVVFALCAVVAGVMLVRGAGTLTLGPDGLTVWDHFRKRHTPWRETGAFTVARVPTRLRSLTFVTYDDPGATGFTASAGLRLVGRSGSLSETYGLPHHDELRDLLTQWRARALDDRR